MAIERRDWGDGVRTPTNGEAGTALVPAELPDPATIVREMESYSGPGVPARYYADGKEVVLPLLRFLQQDPRRLIRAGPVNDLVTLH